MGEILSEQQVADIRYKTLILGDYETTIASLAASHEALRARLAEVEAERDAAMAHLQSVTALIWREQDDAHTARMRAQAAEARLAEVEQALRTALRVIDTTHALAFGRDALALPCDGRSLAEHGGVGVYCWACEFTLEARAVLDKGEPTDE